MAVSGGTPSTQSKKANALIESLNQLEEEEKEQE